MKSLTILSILSLPLLALARGGSVPPPPPDDDWAMMHLHGKLLFVG